MDERGTPRNALYFVSAWIGILAVTGQFEFLIRFMMIVAITVDTIVLMGYFRLRSNRPELDRPFRVPGHPWLPAVTIALNVAILAIIVVTQPALALGGGSMIAGLALAGWIVTRRGRAAD